MPDVRIGAALGGLLLLGTAGQAQAWGSIGHHMISSMAMEMLPDGMPAFLQTEDVPYLIGELSREPDRWRDAGTTHDKERNSGHWINLDDQGRSVGGPTWPSCRRPARLTTRCSARSATPSTARVTCPTTSSTAGSSW